MGNVDFQQSAGYENAAALPQQRDEVNVLQNIIAQNLPRRLIFERQRQIVQIMNHIHARQFGNIKVHPAWQNMMAASEVNTNRMVQ